MAFNPGYIGTGAYKTNATSLMQSRTTFVESGTSGKDAFAQALATASSPEAVQKRQEAKSCMQTLAQCQQAGVDLKTLSQSMQGGTYASVGDYLSALSQTATQSLTATA
jgi:hypothetical protein